MPRIPGRVWLTGGCWLALGVCLHTGCYTRPESKVSPRRDANALGRTSIHTPRRLTNVAVATDSGAEWIPCVTCHSLRQPVPVPGEMDSLKEFHSGMSFDHGRLACGACHAEGQPPRLHLADGSPLDLVEAMQLCGQCHGQQRTNYERGAHGGMRGNWDLERGDRERNHCVDCHDPHRPAIEQVRPAPPPRDRFMEGPR